jgi:protein ImuA
MPPLESAEPVLDAGRAERLEALRARVRTIERGGAARPGRVLRLGLAAVDAALPDGGLGLGAVHELGGTGEVEAMGAATGFCAALLSRLMSREAGPVLWCTARDDLYAPGLARLGLDPDRLLVLRARREAERLWAMEEGLGYAALAAVICEVGSPGLVAGRRLQLAAERGGVTGFLLCRPEAVRRLDARPASAAVTRWRLAAVPSDRTLAGGPGAPRWRAELLRCRGGRPGDWIVEWDHATGGFRLAAAVRDGSVDPASATERRSA